ncbi:MAG: hypothetical protein ACYTAF_14975, partial [Planctomycetota bacterium]
LDSTRIDEKERSPREQEILDAARPRITDFLLLVRAEDADGAARFLDAESFGQPPDQALRAFADRWSGGEPGGKLKQVVVKDVVIMPEGEKPVVRVTGDVIWSFGDGERERATAHVFFWAERKEGWVLTVPRPRAFFDAGRAEKSLRKLGRAERDRGRKVLARMESFFEVVRKGDYAAAAAYLDPQKFKAGRLFTIQVFANRFRTSGKEMRITGVVAEEIVFEEGDDPRAVVRGSPLVGGEGMRPKRGRPMEFAWVLRKGTWFLNDLPKPPPRGGGRRRGPKD